MRKYLVLILLALLLSAPMSAQAARLSFQPERLEVAPGQMFEVTILLDTEKENVNALEGKIVFPTDSLVLKEVRDGNSLINFWIERATPGQNEVPFSGVIPGGYQFPNGLVMTLVFQAKAQGEGSVGLKDTQVLLNDGQGTAAKLVVAPLTIRVSNTAAELPGPNAIVDTEMPEAFVPVVSHDANIFDGALFLSFAAQDKQSGIDYYEVQETYPWENGRWLRAASPYRLENQHVTREINVRAIDKAGNIRQVTLSAETTPTLYERLLALGILLIVIALSVFVLRESPATRGRKSLR